jgi:transposase InsO family protein
LLHDYSDVGDVTCSFAGVGSGAAVKGIGSLLVKGDRDQHIRIDNVFHIDQLRHTLIGVLRCARSGVYTLFDNPHGFGNVMVHKNFFAYWSEDPATELPQWEAQVVRPSNHHVALAATVTLSSSGLWGPEINTVQLGDLWHRRPLHPGRQAMERLKRQGLMPAHVEPPEFCEPCHLGKSHRISRLPSSSSSRTSRPLELLHVDVVEPLPATLPPMRAQYVLVITDDYSRFRIVALTATKSAVPNVLLSKIRRLHTSLAPLVVAALRSDNGDEFTAARLTAALQQLGITSQFTPPYAPQSNGKAERSNRAIFERVRTCLTDTGLPAHM